MNNELAASCLAELGNPTRIHIFRLLVRAGDGGATVGNIQRHLGIPGSTLSHHLAHLTRAGLIEQRREGRSLWCTAQHSVMNSLIEYLTSEGCMGLPTIASGHDSDHDNEEAA